MHSPASSSNSSRSGSPDTRATTPASSSSVDLASKYSYLPQTYVSVSSSSLNADLVEAIFNTHAGSCSRLGLVVSADASVLSLADSDNTWTKARTGERDYLVSSTWVYEPTHGYSPEAIVPTSPAQARVQLVLSECGLRSIIALPLQAEGTLYVLEKPSFAYKPVAYTNAHSLAPSTSSTSPSPSSPSSCTSPSSPSSSPNDLVTGNIPTLADWHTLWATWDTITLRMIPPSMLHQKPIDLRHKCLFYIGHIPTFVDMLLVKALGHNGGEDLKPMEPSFFWNIFERGIDPHVDDPEHCHNHSEVPVNDADWPTLASILAFRDGVRARLAAVYERIASGDLPLTRNLARTLVMTYEHEGFHVETLLYMLIQKAGDGATIPPPAPASASSSTASASTTQETGGEEEGGEGGSALGFTAPVWDALAEQWAANPAPDSASVVLGPADIVMGHDDSEADDFVPWPSSSSSTSSSTSSDASPSSDSSSSSTPTDPRGQPVLTVAGRTFGWDNESPARAVHVPAFRAEWRPITNAEFAAFWRASEGAVAMPKSWVLRPSPNPNGHSTNDNSANSDADLMVRTLYGFVPLEGVAASWPVLTSYDDLVKYAKSKGGRLPTEPELRLFLDTYDVGHEGGANVGFRNWHPVPATTGLDAHGGKGSNGGVWEWTSTVFDTHDGLVPTQLFTGYSEDFFDTKHQVALGASYATIPRLGRRTVRNFYQHNYPYPWIGARVVYDV